MSTYQTDDEQVEAIKKWWKENGKSVLGGIVLGIAVIGGWQWWQVHQRNQGEAASATFDAMRQAIFAGQIDQAVEEGKRLIGEFAGSTYASLAALELARVSYDRGEKAAARNHLRWVTDEAGDPSIRELARLRLAQLLLDMNEGDALQSVLAAKPLPAFEGEFAVVRGDLARIRGDVQAARAAYEEALAKGVADEAVLRMKLIDIGGTAAAS